MLLSARTARRAVAGALGTGALAGAMLFGALPSAMAEPPNCTAADLASRPPASPTRRRTYLFTHPDVNYFFTGLEGKNRDEVRAEVEHYMNANPR